LTRNRRSRQRAENDDYAAFARRIVAAHGRRIAAGDVERLRDLVTLADEVDQATATAVAGLRRVGYSWAELATRLGITRQAAQQRWGACSLWVACNPNETDSNPSYFAGRKAT